MTIYDAFYDEYTKLNAFLHSHSYTGNPLACAAANATLAIFREEPVLERNRATAAHMLASVEHLRDHPHVAEIRQCGMILAIELMKDPATRTPWPWEERRGLRIYRHALERGALIRPLGTTIYFMPPYVITPRGDRPAGPHRHRRHRARMRVTRIYVEQTLVSGRRESGSRAGGPAPHARAAPRGRRCRHALRWHRRRICRHARARRQEDLGASAARRSAIERESPLQMTLIQGMARGERMDLIVQKATELGVTRIVPVFAERSVVKVDASKSARKLEHWRSIAISACEQCGRNRVPEVTRTGGAG